MNVLKKMIRCALCLTKHETYSLKFRILSRLTMIISLILMILTASIFAVFSRILLYSAESRGKDDIQLLSYLVQDALEDAITASKILSVSEEVQTFLNRKQESTASSEVAFVRTLMSEAEKNVLFQDYVHSFCIVTTSRQSYLNTSPNSNDFLDWFEEYALMGGSVEDFQGFTNVYTYPVTVRSSSPVQLFSYICPVNVLTANQPVTIGHLIININFDQLLYNLNKQTNFFGQIGILNQEKELIYLSSGDADGFLENFASMMPSAGKSVGKRVHENYYISQYLQAAGWYLTVSTDLFDSFYFLQSSNLLIGLCVMFFIVLCILVCLYPLLNDLTCQIRELSGAIDQVRLGNLDASVCLTGSVELKNISGGFNLMTASIKEHIRRSVEETELSQKLSFELLVAKINPHFIYNTLNSIIYLARKGDCDSVIQMTGALYLSASGQHPSGAFHALRALPE